MIPQLATVESEEKIFSTQTDKDARNRADRYQPVIFMLLRGHLYCLDSLFTCLKIDKSDAICDLWVSIQMQINRLSYHSNYVFDHSFELIEL